MKNTIKRIFLLRQLFSFNFLIIFTENTNDPTIHPIYKNKNNKENQLLSAKYDDKENCAEIIDAKENKNKMRTYLYLLK